MDCPITQNEMAYMEEMAKKKQLFSLKKEIPDVNGHPIKIYIYSRFLSDNSNNYENLLKIWGDPYVISTRLYQAGGDYYGVGRGYKLEEFLPVEEFVKNLWGTAEFMYKFPQDDIRKNENQMQWF